MVAPQSLDDDHLIGPFDFYGSAVMHYKIYEIEWFASFFSPLLLLLLLLVVSEYANRKGEKLQLIYSKI